MIQKNSGKFHEIVCNTNELEIIDMKKFKQPIVKFSNPISEDVELITTGWTRIGSLADVLDIPRNVFKQLVVKGEVDKVNKIIKLTDKPIKVLINTLDNGTLFVYNIASDKFTVVPFGSIRNVIKQYDELAGYIESEFNNSKVWEKQFSSFEMLDDKFDVILRITSGRNTSESAIKVIVYIRVKSCTNSIQPATYTPIKHYENWNNKLIETIDEALITIPTIIEAIKTGAEQPLTIEQGYDYIDNLKFEIKDEKVISDIKTVLKSRFAYEFETNKQKNRFGLSQSLSFLGTHGNNNLTDRTKEILREQSFNVINVNN